MRDRQDTVEAKRSAHSEAKAGETFAIIKSQLSSYLTSLINYALIIFIFALCVYLS